ncbi:T84 [Tupaiid betaherpesvirus 1]|uniref:T84 n=1 Tax=Tupaiid herpesvirus 1 (strain 1) TaxID=10397 RepID=Q91TL3_TUHV1|nr:T84 [Tupaiid betaherpesvirus 1]AAK57128.1 T84 [Tupaiid betaherpesvirus 1]
MDDAAAPSSAPRGERGERSDVVTLEEIALAPTAPEASGRLLQVKLHFRPDELLQPFQVIFLNALSVADAGGDAGGDDGDAARRTVWCVSSDRHGDLDARFCVFETTPGCKLIPVRLDRDAQKLCILRLTLNVFALRLVKPELGLLPLRARAQTENRPSLAEPAPAHLVSLDRSDEALHLRLTASDLRWHPITSVLDTHGEFVLLEARLDEREWTAGGAAGASAHRDEEPDAHPDPPPDEPSAAAADARATAAFGELLWASDPVARLGKLVLLENRLRVQLCRRPPTRPSETHFPPPAAVSLRLRLFRRAPPPGPYLSGTPAPYFRPVPDNEYALDVLAPHDFFVTPQNPYQLRVYRKHYGRCVGFFAPKTTARFLITAGAWHPRTWLELVLACAQEEPLTVHRGELLGRLYFSALPHRANLLCNYRFADRVHSQLLHGRGREAVALLGLTVDLRDLPPLRLRAERDFLRTTALAVVPR